MLRLAQLRDWLDGQVFGDLVQQRLGPPGGTELTASRLGDLVPAALIRLLAPVIGVTRAEIVGVVFWPELLLLIHLLLVGALARRLGTATSGYAAIAIAALAFPAIALFGPGRIDHYGLLIVLTEAVLLALITRRYVWAGLAAVALIAVTWPGGWSVGEAGLLAQPLGRALAWAGLPSIALVTAIMVAARRRTMPMIAFALAIGASMGASFVDLRSLWLGAALAAPVLAQLVVAATRRGAAWQIGAWIVSAGLVWQAVGELLVSRPAPAVADCTDRETLTALRRLDTGAFAAPAELSAYIVGATLHRSLAGPAAANARGNAATAELFRTTPEEARYQASLWSVDYVALCPARDGGLPPALLPPSGLAAHLIAGAPPAWLDPVPLVGSELLVWRVQPVAAPGMRP